MDVGGERQLAAFFQTAFEKVRVLGAGREHEWHAVHEADLDVLQTFADAAGGFENGEFFLRRVAADFLEEIDAVVGLVGAVHDEVEVAVDIEIHRQGPRPQADAEVHDQAGVIVFEALEAGGAGGGGGGGEGEKEGQGENSPN